MIEGHTAARFAWLRKNEANGGAAGSKPASSFSMIKMLYNLAYWVFLLPFLSQKIGYGFGFTIFTIVIGIRLLLNLYVNNLLKPTPDQYERFPFRP